jgi:catechol 2,3-dioxygenase-like lactoylglutathione lyase family enzyme
MLMRAVLVSALLLTVILLPPAASSQQQAPANVAPPTQRPVVRMGTKPQEFLMTKVTVTDLVKSYEFYTQIMGLKLVTSPDVATAKAPTPNDPEKDFVELPLNYSGSMADPLFLLVKLRGKKPPPEFTNMITLGFKVPDSRATIERAIQAGYKAPRGVPGEGQAGFIEDPDGYKVEVVQVQSFAPK